MKEQADIGVFGGSGFYQFIDDIQEVKVETPYGSPSDKVMIGKLGAKRVAFLPRHGRDHSIPPHQINYRANLWAMKSLGITRIISPCAAGSLQKNIKPGDFVICDQYVDRTSGRKDTFYDGPIATHVSPADPYCEELRPLAARSCIQNNINAHSQGTVVVIQGPRFSTKSESKWFKDAGWEVINMTQYPEAFLARELELCVVNISLITDYDSGIDDIPPVSHSEVIKVFNENIEKLKQVLFTLIELIPEKRENCNCANVLKHARFG